MSVCLKMILYLSVCGSACMYVWMDGWMDGWTDVCIYSSDVSTYLYIDIL